MQWPYGKHIGIECCGLEYWPGKDKEFFSHTAVPLSTQVTCTGKLLEQLEELPGVRRVT